MSIIREEDVRRHLNPPSLIAALEDAFRSRYDSMVMPLRIPMNVANRTFLLIPCHDPSAPGWG